MFWQEGSRQCSDKRVPDNVLTRGFQTMFWQEGRTLSGTLLSEHCLEPSCQNIVWNPPLQTLDPSSNNKALNARLLARPRHKFVTGATLLQLPGSVHGHGQLAQLCFYFYERQEGSRQCSDKRFPDNVLTRGFQTMFWQEGSRQCSDKRVPDNVLTRGLMVKIVQRCHRKQTSGEFRGCSLLGITPFDGICCKIKHELLTKFRTLCRWSPSPV
jgi:hypothetical protein